MSENFKYQTTVIPAEPGWYVTTEWEKDPNAKPGDLRQQRKATLERPRRIIGWCVAIAIDRDQHDCPDTIGRVIPITGDMGIEEEDVDVEFRVTK